MYTISKIQFNSACTFILYCTICIMYLIKSILSVMHRVSFRNGLTGQDRNNFVVTMQCTMYVIHFRDFHTGQQHISQDFGKSCDPA